jgi:DNA-binding HxlR family transcriptional regulator
MSRCRKCAPVPEEVRRAADLLERRWLLSIVYAAHEGANRFNEFRYAVGDIPPRTLAARLTELERAGVLDRTVVDARPPRVLYSLTADGRRLKEVMDALRVWAGQHAG